MFITYQLRFFLLKFLKFNKGTDFSCLLLSSSFLLSLSLSLRFYQAGLAFGLNGGFDIIGVLGWLLGIGLRPRSTNGVAEVKCVVKTIMAINTRKNILFPIIFLIGINLLAWVF